MFQASVGWWGGFVFPHLGVDAYCRCRGGIWFLVGWGTVIRLIKVLSAEGMSTRAIAPIVGADRATVHRDVARAANAAPAPDVPQPDPDPIITGRDEWASFIGAPSPQKVRKKSAKTPK